MAETTSEIKRKHLDSKAFDVVIKKAITNEMIDDLLVAALEGGINYWCVSALPKDNDYKFLDENEDSFASEVISKGGTLVIKLDEPIDVSENLNYELNLQNLQSGWKKYQEMHPDFDFENHDAGDADAIVQLALFNELVFA